VFDAKVTNDSFQPWSKNQSLDPIVEKYNATVRFVSTMSGLTRWQFTYEEKELAGDTEFGDEYSKAIEEPWYQNAIFQHYFDKDSFVYTVEHKEKQNEKIAKAQREMENEEDGSDPPIQPPIEPLQVSASMAIFPRDGGSEAPSCVVGFQFSHQLMQKSFVDITSTVKDGVGSFA
jgi:voltage-dependent calcium channel alpha-2/delta-4